MGTNTMEIYAAGADKWIALDNNYFYVNHMNDKLLPMDDGKLFTIHKGFLPYFSLITF